MSAPNSSVDGRRRRQHEIPGEHQRAEDVDAAEQRQLVPALAGPAEEQAAEHVEAADHAERLRAQHRVHAADRQIGRQMRGEKHELHAADEIGAGHHHEGGVAECDFHGRTCARSPRSHRTAASAAESCRPGRHTTPPATCRSPARRNRRGQCASHNPRSAPARSAPTTARRASPPPRRCPAPCSARSPAPRAPRPTSQSPPPCRPATCRSARRRRS